MNLFSTQQLNKLTVKQMLKTNQNSAVWKNCVKNSKSKICGQGKYVQIFKKPVNRNSRPKIRVQKTKLSKVTKKLPIKTAKQKFETGQIYSAVQIMLSKTKTRIPRCVLIVVIVWK